MLQTTFSRHFRSGAISVALTVLLGACATTTDPTALSEAERVAVGDADKLLIVDCLLPGQVRKLGTKATYVTARRPIKTSASLCEIRGGEYTAYDRANVRTALAVWLPGAQAGDPEAQNYVGEVYEKGLGVSPDYSLAAQWYRKAAEQGNARSQTNLGHLYEQGLGVSPDKVAALNWYRQASGLGDDALAFTSSIQQLQTQADSSTQRAAQAERDAEQLRSQIQQLQGQVSSQRSQQDATRRELERAQRELQQPAPAPTRSTATTSPAAPASDAEVKRLKQQLASQIQQQSQVQKEAELLRARLEAENQGDAALKSQLEALEQDLTTAKAEKQRLETAAQTLLTQRGDSLKQARAELDRVRQTLEQQQQAQSGQSDAEAARLRQQLDASAQRIAELEAGLSASQQRDAGQADLDVQKARLIEARRELERTRQQVRGQAPSESAELRRLNEQLQQQQQQLEIKEQQIQKLIERVADSSQKLATTEGQILALEGEARVVRTVLTRGGDASPEEAATAKPPEVEFGRYYALVIGNNNYADFPNLQTAANDARAIAGVLQGRYGFKTQLLVDANRYQILTALNKFRETLTENDNFLLYYAGHGEYDRSNTRGHWLPVDAEADSNANWIANDQVTDIVNTTSAKHVMVIADSCYSGALTRSVTTSIEGGRSTEKQIRWLKLMAQTRSRTVLSSGGLKPVLDGGGGNHSVFANQLLQVLRGNKQILEGPLLYRAVARRVKAAAAKLGVSQDPQYSPISFAGDLGAPFFFKPADI